MSVEGVGQLCDHDPESRMREIKQDGFARAQHLGRQDQVKVFRLRRFNAADQASARRDQARQARNRESRDASQRRSSKADRLLANVVGPQCDEHKRRQMLAKVEQGRFRSGIATEHLSVSGSARRLRWAQVKVNNVAEVRRLEFINRQCLRQVAEPVKRALEEKDHRVHMANRLRRRPVEREQRARQEKECRERKLSRSSAAERLVQLSATRVRHNQTAGESDNQRKRHRQGHDNFYRDKASGSGTRNTGAAFLF